MPTCYICNNALATTTVQWTPWATKPACNLCARAHDEREGETDNPFAGIDEATRLRKMAAPGRNL